MPQQEDSNRVDLTMAALFRAANGPSVFQRIDQRRILNHAAEVIEDPSWIASCVGQRCENDDVVARVRDCALFISVMSSERVIGDLLACAAEIRDLRIKTGLIAIKISPPGTSASLPNLIRIIIRNWFLSPDAPTQWHRVIARYSAQKRTSPL